MPIYITLFLREQVDGVAESDMNNKLLLLKRKQMVKLLTWHGMARNSQLHTFGVDYQAARGKIPKVF